MDKLCWFPGLPYGSWLSLMAQRQTDQMAAQAVRQIQSEKIGWICGHRRVVCVTFDGGPLEDHGF